MTKEEQEIKEREQVQSLMEVTVLEEPEFFTMTDGVKTVYYYIYQPSLGISLLSERLKKKLEISRQLLLFNQEYEFIRICTQHRDTVLRYVAIHTFKRRSDALEEKKVQERIVELQPLNAAELAGIVKVILSWDRQTDVFVKHLGLDKERQQRERIARLKDEDGGSMTFGGRSVYGALLDNAAERYGWELGYIMWGISLTNLNMMLQDSVQSVYLSEEDRKKLHIRAKGRVIKADDPKNIDAVKAFLSGC